LHDELERYDPVLDGQANFNMPYGSGNTKPGGHYRETKQLQRGLKFAYKLRFPGQLFDGQAGLHDNWLRNCDPAVARYVQSDPIGIDAGINTFTCVGNNSLTCVDLEKQQRTPASAPRTSNPYQTTTRR